MVLWAQVYKNCSSLPGTSPDLQDTVEDQERPARIWEEFLTVAHAILFIYLLTQVVGSIRTEVAAYTFTVCQDTAIEGIYVHPIVRFVVHLKPASNIKT